MNPIFFYTNRKKLSNEIKEGFLLIHSGIRKKVSANETYDFRPNKMFYYLTGLSGPGMVLLLHAKNTEPQEILFIPEEETEQERWEGKGLSLSQTEEKGMIKHICRTRELADITQGLINNPKDLNIWITEDDNQLEEFRTSFNLQIPPNRVENISPYLSAMRKVKKSVEIEAIKNTIQIAKDGVIEVIKAAKENIYEYELEAVFDFKMKSSGLKTGQYHTILGSGKNATILHYLDNNCLIKKDELILIDIDVENNHYHCDFTRVFPVSGKFTERQKEIYTAVLNVQKQIISMVRPGITFGELNEMAKELLWLKCKELGLDTINKQLDHYYFHNIGHLIGLDTHDVGELTDESILMPGMVLTIEPGLYILSENIGIRIEDMIEVSENGYENLTKDLIKEVSEIELLTTKSGGCY